MFGGLFANMNVGYFFLFVRKFGGDLIGSDYLPFGWLLHSIILWNHSWHTLGFSDFAFGLSEKRFLGNSWILEDKSILRLFRAQNFKM